jgi:hypothetical protein
VTWEVSRDRLFVIQSMQLILQHLTVAHGKENENVIAAVETLKRDGALERLLQMSIQELEKDSSNRKALTEWTYTFSLYLHLHMPKQMQDLYLKPLNYLLNVLCQLDTGSVPTILQPASVNNRPMDHPAKRDFRIRCVVAADLIYNSEKPEGGGRSRLTREKADKIISKLVREAAKKQAITVGDKTIRGWRREIREAQRHEALHLEAEIIRDIADKALEVAGAGCALELVPLTILEQDLIRPS